MAENFFGITDIGKVRTNNEDTFVAEISANGRYIIASAIDGVGGYSGGEVAAALARESIIEHLNKSGSAVPEMMREALLLANERIYNQRLEVREHESMACVLTLVVADVANNEFHYIHVGDTRLYLFRDHSLVKLTKDQSFVGFLEDSGRLTEADAMAHPKRNEINKALGFNASLEADYFEAGQSPFLPGDTLLLCSDGLTDMIDKTTITKIIDQKSSLSDKVKELVKAANEKGGKDNITAVLLKNDKESVKQEATMPLASEKKKEADPIVDGQRGKMERAESEPAKVAGRRKGPAVFLLSLISIALLASTIYLLWELGRRTNVENKNDVVSSLPDVSESQQKLQEAISNHTGDTLVLSDSVFTQPIMISDSLTINSDSLFILARGKIVLQRDSAFNGPALIIPSNVKQLTLSGIIFDGFDVAISSASNGLTMQGLQFINCNYPVQRLLTLPSGSYLNGTISEAFSRVDTTAQAQKKSNEQR